ncbi:MAG: hypothetical protein RR816_05270 [Clostridia bacterium]
MLTIVIFVAIYAVLLCFMLFKSGLVAKGIFGAHGKEHVYLNCAKLVVEFYSKSHYTKQEGR